MRAYGVGESTGDTGYTATAELRCAPEDEGPTFYDTGDVTFNASPWAGQGSNRSSLSGYGVGFIWSRSDAFLLNASYSWRASDRPSTIGDNPGTNGRLWVSSNLAMQAGS